MVAALPKIALVFFLSKQSFVFTFSTKISQCYSVLVVLFVILLYVLLFCKMESVNTSSGMNVRYNFIAVNYLIYTNEVIGNIMESYPVIPLFSLFALWIIVFHCPKSKNYIENIPSYIQKIKISGIYLLLLVLHCFLFAYLSTKENSRNVFMNELQANGIYKFYFAFVHSELTTSSFTKRYQLKKHFLS
jgi:hypothetical protein